MRKPISKHALRRAMERVRKDGFLSWEHPAGTVVDRIWHELGKSSYNSGRKKPISRRTVRETPVPDVEGPATT
jgi:DNA-binding FadR family transcriptional regulator